MCVRVCVCAFMCMCTLMYACVNVQKLTLSFFAAQTGKAVLTHTPHVVDILLDEHVLAEPFVKTEANLRLAGSYLCGRGGADVVTRVEVVHRRIGELARVVAVLRGCAIYTVYIYIYTVYCIP